jgi:hypothetical protein
LDSKGFKERLIERGFPVEKMKTILLGADKDIFREVKINIVRRIRTSEIV